MATKRSEKKLPCRLLLQCLSGIMLVVLACSGCWETGEWGGSEPGDLPIDGQGDTGGWQDLAFPFSDAGSGDTQDEVSGEEGDSPSEVSCRFESLWYLDGDTDGFPRHDGSAGSWLSLCAGVEPPEGYAKEQPEGWDCDDEDDRIHPLATETCDGLDNDCDGGTDEGVFVISYYDNDGDGYGSSQSVVTCEKPKTNVLNKSDCDDERELSHPGAPELCDGLDNDCDGEVDDGLGLGEVCYKGAGDCLTWGVLACNEESAASCTAEDVATSEEICDWADNDCDGKVDEGLTEEMPCGSSDVGECSLGAVIRYCVEGEYTPWTPCTAVIAVSEVCDGLDNDCDGAVDEGLDLAGACGETNVGQCKYGMEFNLCAGGQYSGWHGCDAIVPVPEICDGKDNDCDGEADEGLKTLYFQDADGDAFGNPFVQKLTCNPPSGFVEIFGDCDDTDATVNPLGVEICDGKDNDCDGEVDFGWECCESGGQLDVVTCPSADIVYVVDNSGSMEDNDPLNIRYKGLKLTVDQMKATDRGLVVVFADYAQVMGQFTSDKQILKNQLVQAHNAWVGSGTEIGEALVGAAFPAFNGSTQSKRLILFTDGDTASSDSWSHPATVMSQSAAGLGISVYAIGLGAVDEGYLKSLSSNKYVHVSSANDIPEVFEKVFTMSSVAVWKECTADHTWVEKTGECAEDCAVGITSSFYYTDEDVDGWGVYDSLEDISVACEVLPGYSPEYGDCDDADGAAFPGNPEMCDGVDNDCDGKVDEQMMLSCLAPGGCIKGESWCETGVWTECDGPPVQPEKCDGLDNDCDGDTDEDLVQDCQTACGSGVEICISGMWANCDAPPVYGEKEDGIDNDCDGQVDETEPCWSLTFGGAYLDAGYRILQLSDGGLVAVGQWRKSWYSDSDLWVGRIDIEGNVVSQGTTGGISKDIGFALDGTADGGFVVAGVTSSWGSGSSDGWVRKYDSSGNLAKEVFVGTAGYEGFNDIKAIPGGGYVAVGSRHAQFYYGDEEGLLVRLDEELLVLWEKSFPGASDAYFNWVTPSAAGGLLLAGKLANSYSSHDFWVVRTDDKGDALWSFQLGNPNSLVDDVASSAVEFLHEGSQTRRFAIAGWTESKGAGWEDGYLVITDDLGNVLSERTYGGASRDMLHHIAVVSDPASKKAGFVVAGVRDAGSNKVDSGWMMVLDQEGNLLWEKTYGGSKDNALCAAIPTLDGGFAMVGTTHSWGAGVSDIWALKVNGLGELECY